MRPRRTLNYLLCFILGLGLAAAGYGVAAGGRTGGQKNPITSIRPTGIGLPRIGFQGTVGAGDVAAQTKSYHDSGRYETDLEAVGSRAENYLDRRVPKIRKQARRSCRANGVRHCPKPKLAIVLDIDETSLSNYQVLAATDFTGATAALAASLLAATAPPIDPTLELFDDAVGMGVDVFFITGRPEVSIIRDRTEQNLTGAGYSGWKELILNPGDAGGTVAYKSGAREQITDDGYDIVVNLGDQDSDLKGGFAEKAFKYPNPFYFIGD
jgi:HAD superfamily, subfamily IIIB (Acid phosphatase)